MASIPQPVEQDQTDDDLPPVTWVTPEEGRRMFDEAVRAWVGMSGEEFIQRWEAGEFADIPDDLEHRRYIDLVLMIPLARQDA